MNKKIGLLSLFFIIALILIGNVPAAIINGRIGNARMVLRADVGEEIEKYVLVRNVNNETLEIELSASGDLEKYVEIKDEKFTLNPNEEKKAYFTIKVAKEGTTETNINVKFTPTDGKNGVGLSSTIVVIGKSGGSWFDWGSDDNNINDTNKSGVSVTAGKVTGGSGKTNYAIIALSITGIMLLVFVVLLVIALKIKKKRASKLKKSVKRNE